MLTFSELVKTIREEAGLTQEQFAQALGVSTILIAMVETGQKEVSKNLILKIAELMEVHPASITPFLFIDKDHPLSKKNPIENWLLQFGEKMQTTLIKTKAKKLRHYAV